MIKILPKVIADKIAAGEVVERPLSVVKELVENSIDAQATVITCEIRKGGKEYIRVTDNGMGIDKDQVALAFLRHATSKISTEEDLNSIGTLGFRGEALASIAAVSSVELITKTRERETGAKIVLRAGEAEEISDAACEEGTTIIVTDLFFNIPARRKFLKPDNSEAALITDYLSKMALAYPGVKFRLISNGTILYSTLGKGDLKQAILTLYNPQLAKGLVDVKGTKADMSITGFVSSPAYSRNNKRWQIFFVNGRWIKNKVLEEALEEAFYDKLFEGRHPSAFLFLSLDPKTVDVNIHPHKTEIKFYDERAIKEFVTASIRKSLLTGSAAPNAASIARTSESELSVEEAAFKYRTSDSEDQEYTGDSFSGEAALKELKNRDFSLKNGTFLNSGFGTDEVDRIKFMSTNDKSAKDNLFKQMRKESENLEKPRQEAMRIINGAEAAIPDGIAEGEDLKDEGRRFWFTGLRIIGQAFATYILAMDENCVYFIDQHAAHERILYERLMMDFGKAEKASQPMLMPMLLQMTIHEKEAAFEKLQLLRDLGFVIEDFGPGDIIIKEIPACMDLSEAEDFARHMLEAENPKDSSGSLKREDIISASCKAAIKANDRLTEEAMKRLFIDLDACENPFSCPHGRPTFLRFTLSDIERLFKRK